MNKNLEVCVGIFDDPENQEQSIFSLNLMESGHIAICGRSASGKSTFFLNISIFIIKREYSRRSMFISVGFQWKWYGHI